MNQRPSTRRPWWHRQTGWYAVPLVALVSLLLVAGVTSSTGAAAQTATLTADTSQSTSGCSDKTQSTPACFLLAPFRNIFSPLGPTDASQSDSYIALRPSSDEALPKVQWEFWLDGAGQVRFHDLGTNRCMNVWPSNKRPWMDQCHVNVPGDETFAEDFYVRAVDTKPGFYRVVPTKYPTLCLTDRSLNAVDDVAFAPCSTTPDASGAVQLWAFSGVTNNDGTLNLAADWLLPYVRRLALEQCTADETSCLWTTKAGADTDEADLPVTSTTKCVGPVERNAGTAAQPGNAAVSYTTAASDESAGTDGTTSSVAIKTWLKPLTGLSVSGLAPANPIQISYGVVNSQFSEFSWARKQDISQTAKIDSIPVAEWGWFSEESYSRNLPGTWTFARGTTTQFTATYTKFNVPSYAPGTTKDVLISTHTSVNPPDADCSDPLKNASAITAEQDLPTQLTASAPKLVGMSFTTGAKRLKVSELGRKRAMSCPNGGTTAGPVTIGIYKSLPSGGGLQAFPGGTVTVKLATVSGGTYAYAPLPAPFYLEPNTTYYLLTSESPGGPCWVGAHSVTPEPKLGLTAVQPVEWIGTTGFGGPNNPNSSYDSLNMRVSS